MSAVVAGCLTERHLTLFGAIVQWFARHELLTNGMVNAPAPSLAQAQSSAPNLAGTYRCVPEPSSCQWQEQNPTISQTGATLQLNINKDEFAEGKLTSNITVGAGPPFNALGLIRPDHSIEWSNGTKWIKQ